MYNLQKEAEFFHDIAKKVIELVSDPAKDTSIAIHKRDADFATQTDVNVENLIVSEIKKRFPNDAILAEEANSDEPIPHGRIWIIDPICGTNNLARGIKNFCTNIALADNHQLIASCVIDHSQNNYYWSTGDKKVHVNTTQFDPSEERFDTYIEVDYGALGSVDKAGREKHSKFVANLSVNTSYYLISLSTSLGFAYVAINKVDAFVNVYNHPWDVCASVFLIQQAGGVVTDINGDVWKIGAPGVIAARDSELHEILLNTYLMS